MLKVFIKQFSACLANGDGISMCTNSTVNMTLDVTCSATVPSTDGCQIRGHATDENAFCIATRIKDKGHCTDRAGTSKDGVLGCKATGTAMGDFVCN